MTIMETAIPCRIDTDKGRLEMQREQQNRLLLRAGLLASPLLLLFILLPLLLRQGDTSAARLLLPGFAIAAGGGLLLWILFRRSRRLQDRKFDQHFICSPQKLVHVVQGKPRNATPYCDIWLGSDTLLLGDKNFPLYIGYGKSRTPFWTVHDVQREIGRRIPPAQFFASDYDMGRALLRRRPLLGLRLILARFTVIAVVLLVLGLKLFSFLDHLHVFSLWKIFHPR